MSDLYAKLLIIFDDREFVNGDVCSLVGSRRFGDLTCKSRRLIDHFRAALPEWAAAQLIHLRTTKDISNLRDFIESCNDNTSVCIIAGRAGFMVSERLTQFIERLPYAEENFTDRLYKPLLVFLHNLHYLVEKWSNFEKAPLHQWELPWKNYQRVQSLEPLDLAQLRNFLSFSSGSTATRHFNEVKVDAYYYTKQSSDKRKMLAECSFYNLIPESMRPSLIQTFDYQDEGEQASYKMLRTTLPMQHYNGCMVPLSSTLFILLLNAYYFFYRQGRADTVVR